MAHRSLPGRIFMTLFFMPFLGFGLAFAGFIGQGFVKSLLSRTWRQVPCAIVESRIQDGSYRVRYTYEIEGRRYASTRHRIGMAMESSDPADLQRLVDRFEEGTNATCWVDPRSPERAILEQGSLWAGLIILFPLVFVTVGGGGIYMMWRPERRAEEKALSVPARAKGTMPGWGITAFGSLFMLVGLGVTYGLFVRPLQRVIAARQWRQVPCTVTSSEVRAHSSSGSSSTTYSVDIRYTYRFDDREYHGTAYSFAIGSSSGYESKRRVVDGYPPGSSAVAWVDPADPHDAVLVRDFVPGLLFGLLPLIFFFAGLFVVIVGRATSRKPASPAFQRPDAEGSALATSPRAAARSRPLASFVGMCLACLFWNGIVSVFLFAIISDARKSGAWLSFPLLFLIPFILIGLGLVVGVGYSFLALFNPIARLEAGSGSVPLGGAVEVAWRFDGRTRALERLQIELVGAESATYRRGTSSHTDTRDFRKITIVDTVSPAEIAGGRAQASVPSDTMHSFDASHNKIVWTIKLRGHIPRWPDVTAELPLSVTVPPAEGPMS